MMDNMNAAVVVPKRVVRLYSARRRAVLLLFLGASACDPATSLPMGSDPESGKRREQVLPDDAVIVSATLPTSMRCGGSFAAAVTVQNRGTATWTDSTFKLGTVDDSDPFYTSDTRVYLPPGTTVPPGGTYRFQFALTAPPTPGRYVTDWQMVHEFVRWFGATVKSDVVVTCPRTTVDASTLDRKLLFGYQGWFSCPRDGTPIDGWVHWFRDNTASCGNLTVDLWPDVRELSSGEKCQTGMTLSDGSPAVVYSANRSQTVRRHFEWMRDADLDGVMLQRFSSELRDPRFFAFRDQVARNVRDAAEATGRVFNIMYDVSGQPEATLVDDLKRDFTHLVDDLKLTDSPNYLRHKGRPVLVIWGLGYRDRPGTVAQAQELVRYFKTTAGASYQVTLVGGVPSGWRTLSGDSRSDAGWAAVYRSYDVLSPWSVGGFIDDAGADVWKRDRLTPDLAETRRVGIGYMPVLWPGFSWRNLMGAASPSNQIPRRGGRFFWRQAYNAIGAGATTLFGAMFDEVDEGTAMFKLAETRSAQPVSCSLVPLNVDGEALPSDWYLRVGGEAGRMLRGEQALTATLPIRP